MGRIKTQNVKRLTEKLIKEHRDEFKDNFENNKKALTKFADVPSRKLRNTIAGYITRIIKGKEEL